MRKIRMEQSGEIHGFHGRGWLEVEQGSVELDGYEVEALDGRQQWHAPYSAPPMQMKSTSADTVVQVGGLHSPLEFARGQPLGSPDLSALESLSYPPREAGGEALHPHIRLYHGAPSSTSDSTRAEDLLPAYRVQWNAQSEQVLQSLSQSSQPQVIAVLGDKGAGKSTFVRALINRLQKRRGARRVRAVPYLLDGDLGQPELGLPGTVSVTSVQEGLLAPPYLQVRWPALSFFVGAASVHAVSERYVGAMGRLAARLERIRKSHPVVFNSHGWMRDLGLYATQAVLDILRPDVIVHIDSDALQTQPTVDLGEVSSMELADWLAARVEATGGRVVRVPSSVPQAGVRPPLGLSAADQRHLRLYAYMTQYRTLLRPSGPSLSSDSWNEAEWTLLRQSWRPMTARPPRQVAWSDVCVSVAHVTLDASQVCRVLNASLVGLVADEALREACTHEDSGGGSALRVLDAPPVGACLGLAICRAVDVERKLFLLVTPCPSAWLERVNVLVVGSMAIPSAFWSWSHRSNLPYIPF